MSLPIFFQSSTSIKDSYALPYAALSPSTTNDICITTSLRLPLKANPQRPSLTSIDFLPIAERSPRLSPLPSPSPLPSHTTMTLTDLTPQTNMSTTTTTTTTTTAQPSPKETVQQWYKSANDLVVGPVRRKRMPAGRHAVVVSPPAKAEPQLQQRKPDEAGKQ